MTTQLKIWLIVQAEVLLQPKGTSYSKGWTKKKTEHSL